MESLKESRFSLGGKLQMAFVAGFSWVLLVGCKAADPSVTSLDRFPSKAKINLSVRENFASSGSVAVSGTGPGAYKIKFTIGYNQGAAGPTQTKVQSGTGGAAIGLRASSSGILNEQ